MLREQVRQCKKTSRFIGQYLLFACQHGHRSLAHLDPPAQPISLGTEASGCQDRLLEGAAALNWGYVRPELVERIPV